MKRYGDIRQLTWRGRTSRRYYVRVHLSDGRSTWKCTGHAARDLAEAQVHAWQLAEILGSAGGGLRSAPSMDIALARWAAVTTIGRSEHYRHLIASWVRGITPTLGQLEVSALNEDHVTGYILGRVEAGKQPRTINLAVKLLRMFCNWCVDQHWLARNPVRCNVSLPVQQSAPRVLSADDETRLLAAAAQLGARAYGYVLCMLTTGFRAGLVHTVRWEHVDLERGMWRIPALLLKSRREFVQPIAPCLWVWLRTHAQERGRIFGTAAIRWWYRIREAAGMPTLKRHDLRRNFVTRCRRAGVQMEVTMALSDHTDVRTMMRFYRRVDVTDTQQALERLEAQRRDVCDG